MLFNSDNNGSKKQVKICLVKKKVRLLASRNEESHLFYMFQEEKFNIKIEASYIFFIKLLSDNKELKVNSKSHHWHLSSSSLATLFDKRTMSRT